MSKVNYNWLHGFKEGAPSNGKAKTCPICQVSHDTAETCPFCHYLPLIPPTWWRDHRRGWRSLGNGAYQKITYSLH